MKFGILDLLAVALGTLFVGLKLTDSIDWSWWWVLAPFWGWAVITVVIVVVVVILEEL